MVRLAVFALTAVVALAPAAARAETPPEQTLSVLGDGTALVVPDVATVYVRASASARTAAGARSEVNRRITRIVAAVRALGIPPQALQTPEISLARVVSHPRGVRRVRYSASQLLSVRVTDLSLLGQLFDVVTRAGATGISGPEFSFSDPSARRSAAERAAIADARTRADRAAAQLGLRVTGVRSVDLDPGDDSGLSTPAAGTQQSAAPRGAPVRPPTIALPGAEEVTAQVRIVFVLGA